jgi:hypothetical protein
MQTDSAKRIGADLDAGPAMPSTIRTWPKARLHGSRCRSTGIQSIPRSRRQARVAAIGLWASWQALVPLVMVAQSGSAPFMAMKMQVHVTVDQVKPGTLLRWHRRLVGSPTRASWWCSSANSRPTTAACSGLGLPLASVPPSWASRNRWRIRSPVGSPGLDLDGDPCLLVAGVPEGVGDAGRDLGACPRGSPRAHARQGACGAGPERP